MLIRDVGIIGGGPAGLFAAILLRRAHPSATIAVYERSVPDETFGFGIAFTRTTLEMILRADEESYAQLTASSVPVPPQELRVGGRSAWSRGNLGALGISRATLLRVLTERAIALGVDVRFGHAVTLQDLAGTQLVIAADGVSSSIRAELGEDVGARITPGRGVFMWLGCDTRLSSNLFAPVFSDAGLFNVHCYPYADDRSTIGVEADIDTWRRAGMDRWTDETPVGESDVRSIEYLQSVFGNVLGGARLLGNRSRWMHFRTVTVDRWHVGNTVLIGDAAHTAHYSVGAGTKMAMDDSVALVEALAAEPSDDLDSALTRYETDRRPKVERLQNLADRSRWWWESLGFRLDLPVDQLMAAYLSRGGAVSARKLASLDQEIIRNALAAWAGDCLPDGELVPNAIVDFVLSRPLRVGTTVLDSRVVTVKNNGIRYAQADVRDPWSDAADSLSAEVTRSDSGANVVILSGRDGREALLDRLSFAERLRRGTESAVGVRASREHEDDIVDALLASRIDVVEWVSS